ncbi:hypothetical protein [Gordonia hydrophobica]|uniref:DUF2269 family protein n=1 Tax=Gordonia hydrophobica TaxID=40516 RepID=A0ABZ2U604_9ACTN|nr:hypothetical protein [Gordonia hydrophobica]MBM7365585.1 heme/copper-type cytochrome/quinol oxidase subunit 2 [Gordonia hydrophobica]
MGVAGLIVLICVGVTGAVTVGAWMTMGDVQRATTKRGRHRRLPAELVLGHMVFGIAAVTAWVCFVVIGRQYAAWVAVALMVIAAVLGITMFVRWIPSYRPRATQLASADGAGPEQNLPIGLVLAHGAFAVIGVGIALATVLV